MSAVFLLIPPPFACLLAFASMSRLLLLVLWTPVVLAGPVVVIAPRSPPFRDDRPAWPEGLARCPGTCAARRNDHGSIGAWA